jgi:dipeptidyl aminopeptidase/acylaminoacyl peptidase
MNSILPKEGIAVRKTNPIAVKLSLVLAVLLFSPGMARAAEPPLIPREILFGNPERTAPQLSPDGTKISWLAPAKNGVLNIWARSLSDSRPADEAQPVTNEPHRPIFWYTWAGDGKHILYLQDDGGDENNHLYSADLASGNVRDLTPFRGVKAQNVLASDQHPGQVLAGLNLRDRHVFDMVRIDLETGAVTLAAQNPGDVLTWTPDNDFVIRAATVFDPKTAQTVIRVRDTAEAPWRDLVAMPFERALFDGQVVGGSLIAGFAPDGKSLVIHSALDSDKGQLVRVDLATGKPLAVLASDPDSDVADAGDRPAVLVNPATHALEAVEFEQTTPHWTFLDAAVGADFARIGQEVPGFLRLIGRDRADRKWIVAAFRSDAPVSYVLYDRNAKKVTPLFNDNPALLKYKLAEKRPVVIKARDGLPLVSYLTLPPGLEPKKLPKKLPLVLDIHGGPCFRDTIDYDAEVQFLANRGYAVLQVNYRGSTGLGIDFLNAGNHQWGRGTQEDLYDAVQWAVGQGIADPKRIAAMGWSGGGYATLRALSTRPDLFACGVDGVGPGDIATLFHSFPPYWGGILTRWRLRVGDPERDADLNRSISPLYHVDQIRAPLLIGQGQNDPRVTLANADAMVKALREAKREVVYVVYPDEGHGFERPENNLDFYGRVEEFLAKHLGGQAEPWKKIEGATAEVR